MATDTHLEITDIKSSEAMAALEEDNWEELGSLTSFDDLKLTSTMAMKTKVSFKTHVQDNIDSLWVQTFIIILVIFDLIIGLTDIVSNEQTKSIITLIIIIIYVWEISLRIYGYGLKKYFSSILDIIDFIAVLGSLVLYILHVYVVYALLVKILRWVRVVRTAYRAIFSRSRKIQRAIRHLQRSNLKGYRDDKYDLDVTYITDHILIMSRPADKVIDQFAHDPLQDVYAFLDDKHPNAYRIYDLCDSDKCDYAFTSKNVLPIDRLFAFATDVNGFCDENKSNVVIIQSTFGLGRCMFMTACLLLYYYPSADIVDIINFIHSERHHSESGGHGTDNISKFLPSQIRYVQYFATITKQIYSTGKKKYHTMFYEKYREKMGHAKIGIVIKHVGIFDFYDEIDPYVNWECDIFQYSESDRDNKKVFHYGLDSRPGKTSALIKRFKDTKPLVLENDFGIQVYKSWGNDDVEREGKRTLIAQLILHSHFINLDHEQCITFEKGKIDFVNEDRNDKLFPNDFRIVIKAKILRKTI